MEHPPLPTLYSFRRCPYAMRARLALRVSKQQCILREVILRNKPEEMLNLSPKGTVPVLQLPDGRVLDESLDIMHWALACNDPQQWLIPQNGHLPQMMAVIANNDGSFKYHLDRYKYASRLDHENDPIHHREEGTIFLISLNNLLQDQDSLFGDRPCLADFAIFPFVRQFANTDRDWFDNQPLANLHRWLGSHLESNMFIKIMQKWPAWKPDDKNTIFPDD